MSLWLRPFGEIKFNLDQIKERLWQLVAHQSSKNKLYFKVKLFEELPTTGKVLIVQKLSIEPHFFKEIKFYKVWIFKSSLLKTFRQL